MIEKIELTLDGMEKYTEGLTPEEKRDGLKSIIEKVDRLINSIKAKGEL